ncbi:hypothetical protein HK405_012871, partial [Cladochytrium tenue]
KARTFTWAEIEKSAAGKKHTIEAVESSGPAYVVIHNRVYDFGESTGFLRWHPGGAVALSLLGQDASGAFDVFHTDNAESIMSNYYVGDLAADEVAKPSEFFEDVTKLRATLEEIGAFKSSKLYYAFKLASNVAIAGLSLWMLAKWGTTSTLAVVAAGLLMALFWQQCGWLAHDALHHQVFKDRRLNDAFGFLVGNVMLGFSVNWWKNKHCTHHAMPNVHDVDPDIDTMPYLAWSEHALELFTDMKDTDVARFLVAYQPVLYFPILALARLAWCYASIMYSVQGHVLDPNTAIVELTTLALHWVAYLGTAFLFCTPLRALLYLFVSQTACGVFLAVVFSVNHNGMPVYTSKAASKIDFYKLQVLTGRDVTPTPANDWFTGGLNYQIEHHMFPSLPRHKFHVVRPLVESLCRKHGVPYHSTSLWNGLGEIVARLASISRAASKLRRHQPQQ